MDEIDRLVESGIGTEAERVWATRVRSGYVTKMLDTVLGDDSRLPQGVIASASDDTDLVVALTRDGMVWTELDHDVYGWTDKPEGLEFDDIIDLTQEEVAFAADALLQGAAGLALRAVNPIAFLDKPLTAAAEAPAPSGAKVVAVVDELDRAAVLELLAIAPGPHVFRRSDGKWVADDAWLHDLRSIKPPAIITINDQAQVASVAAQVDESTRGDSLKETDDTVRASALDERAGEMWLEWALVASAKSEPITAAMPAKLQKYWLTGRGAAKIRWFTPGSWRRCYRQLSKYMNPHSAKGACTNLSQKLGGHGVATHVGD